MSINKGDIFANERARFGVAVDYLDSIRSLYTPLIVVKNHVLPTSLLPGFLMSSVSDVLSNLPVCSDWRPSTK